MAHHATIRRVWCRSRGWGAWLAVATLAVGAGTASAAGPYEVAGLMAVESRWFPDEAAYVGQSDHDFGLILQPEIYFEVGEVSLITLTPFFRYDSADPERTHGDLREAYILSNGPLGDGEWEVRLGVDRVFWGVAESRHLVDIVNQTDLIEHPDEKSKLGQPMAHLTLSGDWGVGELFLMSLHRPRTFSGPEGRLAPSIRVVNGLTTYESPAEEWHVDLAARYSQTIGLLDFGLSVFDGTSRDPLLLPRVLPSVGNEPASVVLAPHYEQVLQVGLDAQLTLDVWLLKLEAIHRSGARNALGEEEDYASMVGGGEYTLYGVGNSGADLVLFAEWMTDGRRSRATNQYQNELFLAARVGLNDVEGTEFTIGTLQDLDYHSRTLILEFNRRLTDTLSLTAEAILLLEVDEADTIVHQIRQDSFIGLNLSYYF